MILGKRKETQMTNLDLHLAEALMAGAFTLVLRGPRV